MEFIEREVAGVFEITLIPHKDSRGFFMRTYDNEVFNKNVLHSDWVQENHSRSEGKGMIRGLHLQLPPFSEAKLVRCIQGAVLDVFIDLRKGSPTFGKWDCIELNSDNNKMIFVPRGFAHGFCTLTLISEVIYKVDNFYSKENEIGIIWNDPDINIEWPVQNPILSEKDKGNLTLQAFKAKYNSIRV